MTLCKGHQRDKSHIAEPREPYSTPAPGVYEIASSIADPTLSIIRKNDNTLLIKVTCLGTAPFKTLESRFDSPTSIYASIGDTPGPGRYKLPDSPKKSTVLTRRYEDNPNFQVIRAALQRDRVQSMRSYIVSKQKRSQGRCSIEIPTLPSNQVEKRIKLREQLLKSKMLWQNDNHKAVDEGIWKSLDKQKNFVSFAARKTQSEAELVSDNKKQMETISQSIESKHLPRLKQQLSKGVLMSLEGPTNSRKMKLPVRSRGVSLQEFSSSTDKNTEMEMLKLLLRKNRKERYVNYQEPRDSQSDLINSIKEVSSHASAVERSDKTQDKIETKQPNAYDLMLQDGLYQFE